MSTINITFYLFFNKEDGNWECHSILSTVRGYGKTEEGAIEDHLRSFNNKTSTSKFDEVASAFPGVTMKKYTLIAQETENNGYTKQ